VLTGCRQQLMGCHDTDNGRSHLRWKLALNLKLREGGFHPTTLVYFRQRLIEHAKADVAMRAVICLDRIIGDPAVRIKLYC